MHCNDRKFPKIPPNPERSNILYNQIFLQGRNIIETEGTYVSNWFPIISFPEELRFHQFDGRMIHKGFDLKTLTFPGVTYKNYLCTFGWEYDFMYQLPMTETYDSSKTIKIKTSDLFDGAYKSNFIENSEAQRLIVQLTNKAFMNRMHEKGICQYELSNKTGYYFKKDQLEKNKINKIWMVGKQKEKNWHFGISAAAKLYPYHVLMVSSHIFFTENGTDLIQSKRMQHAARRRQGKDWWNDDWRSKLMAFADYLTDYDNSFYLEMGSEEEILISTKPMEFRSNFSYELPNKQILTDESELSDMNLLNELDQELNEDTDE